MSSTGKKTESKKSQKQGQDAVSKLDATKDIGSRVKDEAKETKIDSSELLTVKSEDQKLQITTKADPGPMDKLGISTRDPSASKSRVRRFGSESSDHNERGSSDSSDEDDPRKGFEPRTAKRSRLHKDLLLWGLPSYAIRSKLPGKATVLFDGDKN
jgi:hypothetical protein